MKNIKAFLAGFILYVYNEYVYEDWSVINTFGKICCYWAWFIRAMLVWIVSPVFLPIYIFKQSELYKQMQIIKNSPEFQAQMAKLGMFNNNFNI